MDWFRIESRSSNPIQVGENQLVVRSQVVQISFPGGSGGLIYNRPTSVSLRGADGTVEERPVIDVTRLAIIGIAGLGLIVSVLLRRLIHD